MQKVPPEPSTFILTTMFHDYDDEIPNQLRSERLVASTTWDPVGPYHHPMQVNLHKDQKVATYLTNPF